MRDYQGMVNGWLRIEKMVNLTWYIPIPRFQVFWSAIYLKNKLEQLSINNYKLLYTPEIPVATLHSSSSWCYCMPLRQTHSATLFRLWIKSWRSNPPWETSRASLQYCHFTTSWLLSPQIRLLTELIYTPAQPEHVLVFSSKTQLLSISKTPGCILKLLRKKNTRFFEKKQKNPKKPAILPLSTGWIPPEHWRSVRTNSPDEMAGSRNRWVFVGSPSVSPRHIFHEWRSPGRRLSLLSPGGCWAELHRKSTYHIICP